MSTPTVSLDLPIEGMTCATCANRVERGLNALDGVEATVNYATEKAAVRFDPGATAPDALLAAVEAAGYRATLPAADASEDPVDDPDPATALRRRLVVSAVLSAPVLVLSMVPALQFDNWQWLALQLATPVVLWGAWPFHRAAWGTSATAPRRWTPSCRSASSPRGAGRSSRCSSATRARTACGWPSSSSRGRAAARTRSTSRRRRS